jgi:hypothetical protein
VQAEAEFLFVGHEARAARGRGQEAPVGINRRSFLRHHTDHRMGDRHGNAGADLAAVESALQFVAAAPAQQRGVMLPARDVGAHHRLRPAITIGSSGGQLSTRRGERKFLPDQQSVTVAQVVEEFLLEKGPAPDAQDIAAHVRVGADAGLVVGGA